MSEGVWEVEVDRDLLLALMDYSVSSNYCATVCNTGSFIREKMCVLHGLPVLSNCRMIEIIETCMGTSAYFLCFVFPCAEEKEMGRETKSMGNTQKQ